MGLSSRRRKRIRLVPLLALLILALLALYQLGARARNKALAAAEPPVPGVETPPQKYAPLTPISVMPDTEAGVARGQAFFYTYPDSNRLGSYETWRPRELLSRWYVRKRDHVPDNVFVVVQTSPRTVWRNVPTMLMSVLEEFPHFGIYSSTADAVRGAEVVDAIALLSPEFVARSSHLEPYRVMRIVRDSHVNVPLDEIPVVGAASLARFVTLPMLKHAYNLHPQHDWYVVILDSTYVFSGNLRAILAELDPERPIFLGSAVQGPDILFADLGSAVVLSKEAMRRAFASDAADIDSFNARAEAALRGDCVLSKYLKEVVGLELDVGLSGGQFQGNPVNKVPISAKNWCKRIVSANQPHPREHDMLAEYAHLKRGQPILYSDIYYDFIKPYLPSDSQQNWDNSAVDIEFGWDHNSETQAHESLAECRDACTRYPQCLMLRYDAYRQYCGLGISTVSLGGPVIRYDTAPNDELCKQHGVQCEDRRADEGTTSEWLIDRVRAMRETLECDPLRTDTNSEGTEYGVLDQVEGWWHRARRLAQDSDPLRQAF